MVWPGRRGHLPIEVRRGGVTATGDVSGGTATLTLGITEPEASRVYRAWLLLDAQMAASPSTEVALLGSSGYRSGASSSFSKVAYVTTQVNGYGEPAELQAAIRNLGLFRSLDLAGNLVAPDLALFDNNVDGRIYRLGLTVISFDVRDFDLAILLRG